MKTTINYSLVFCIGLAAGFFSINLRKANFPSKENIVQEVSNHVKETSQMGSEVEFFEYGVRLYGKVNFDCGDGELSAVSDLDRVEVIPVGAVLHVIKKDYSIGSYEGLIVVNKDGISKQLPKIFFSIKRDGNIDYFYPSSNSKFVGMKIDGEVMFQ